MEPIELTIYNTRTKSIDKFIHDKNLLVNIYTCGPTVYNRVHIGNLKTFFWSDFIVNYLQALGYKTKHIMNITDIDDKIIKNLEQQNIQCLLDFTNYYTELFLQDIKEIGIRAYTRDNIHKVTDNIDSIVKIIKKLLESGHAYRVSDGSIYFDVSQIDHYPFPDYQKESYQRDHDNQIETNRETNYSTRNIIKSDGIRSPVDFVLWKAKKDGEIFFSTEIGEGRMGWTIECSGITDAILDKLHIKIGAKDLCMPHHTCEILQSESYKPEQKYGDYWIHCGFLNFQEIKCQNLWVIL
jgi:cysteinyl-tRNA synthetase